MTKEKKVYFRILNTDKKRYVRTENNAYLVFEYPAQAWNYIAQRLGDSPTFTVKSWRKE